MSRTWTLFALSALLVVTLVGLAPAQPAQAVPPRQPATSTPPARTSTPSDLTPIAATETPGTPSPAAPTDAAQTSIAQTSVAMTQTAAVPSATTTAGTSTPTAAGGTATPPPLPTSTITTTAAATSTPSSLTPIATSTITATAGTATPTATTAPLPVPSTVMLENGYRITFLGFAPNSDGTATYRYRVEELAGAQDLSNWVLGLPGCAVVSASPEPNEVVNPDPNAGLNGVKWQTGAGFSSGVFSVTLLGAPVIGLVDVAAKGPDLAFGELAGPLCDDEAELPPPAEIEIEIPATPVVVVENGVTFINFVIVIDSSGGPAREVFLVLDLDLILLADLSFLQGVGYVKEIRDGQVIIGIGQNNRIRGGRFELDLRFQVDDDADDGDTAAIAYRLEYRDSDGARRTEPVTVTVVIQPTPPLSPTPAPSASPAPPTSTAIIVIPRLTIAEIDVRFRARWSGGGGLRLYGLPLTRAITLRSGSTVQYFERARFEYHPENEGTEYVILLGRLAVELGYSQPPVALPADDDERRWYFAQTGHLIAPAFRGYWQGEGGLAAYGYPIGAAFVDSRGLTVQYFERVRMELHPEFAGTENAVLLGLLGEELLIRNGGAVEDDD